MTNDRPSGLGRRHFFGLTLGALCGSRAAARSVFAAPRQGHAAHGAPAADARSADEAMAQLVAGNARFERSTLRHGHQTKTWWHTLANAQHPFAVVFSCADSRVSPEVVFDQGLGDLFVIRNAGHVADEAEVASIEYAVAHLGVPLVVVLGHERCGAVQATIAAGASGAASEGHIARLVDAIRPAVTSVKGMAGDQIDLVVRANVELTVTALKESKPLLADLVAADKLRIVGARYDLDTGHVDFLRPTGSARAAK
jgi:carbonic anhydrase